MGVPQCKCEHAAQLIDQICAEFLVEMNNDLGVGLCREFVAPSNQFLTKMLKVVDLAVKNDPDRSILIRDRLMTGMQINDAEASHAEAYIGANEKAVVVRTAMDNRRAHAADVLRRDGTAVKTENSYNAAH